MNSPHMNSSRNASIRSRRVFSVRWGRRRVGEWEAVREAMREVKEEMVRVVLVWRSRRALISRAWEDRGVGGGAFS